MKVAFEEGGNEGSLVTHIADEEKDSGKKWYEQFWNKQKTERIKSATLITAQCFPLYSALLALNRTRVDFFSLDVEGHELKILKTIPWNKVQIKVLMKSPLLFRIFV